MKTVSAKNISQRLAAAAAVLPLLFALVLACLPVTVQAATSSINSIDVTAELNEDGSARITEVWDVEAIADMTEWYITKANLGDSEIKDLVVSDETGLTYTTVGNWDVNGSISDKAGKAGILPTSQGVEICWGVGTLDHHVFTVSYTVTNLVQGYSDADAIYWWFIPYHLASSVPRFSVTISYPGTELTLDNTGVWAFGHEGDSYGVENGVVFLTSNGSMGYNDYICLLVEFKQGMFSPAVQHDRAFGDLLAEAEQGSDYGTDYDGDGYSDYSNGFTNGIRSFFGRYSGMFVVFLCGAIAMLFRFIGKSGQSSSATARMKPEYKDAPYSRELPYNGSLSATYTRLKDLGQMKDDGSIIGAYFLRWLRSRQIEILSQPAGFSGKKTEYSVKLYDARPTMTPVERSLYDMLTSAAGPDWVLQNKEFEKWSRKNYSQVQGWLERYKNEGAAAMRSMGATATEPKKTFFGLITYNTTVVTQLGEALTIGMFGFKRYLKEFTIINEREPREVQLWDEYLVFAQVFGIADEVAAQFKQLYPDYFTQLAREIGVHPDLFDIYLVTRIANSYGRSMDTGYRAGYNAHVSRDSGGGGFSSGGGGFSGGGGGFSGGGGGGR